MKRSIFIVIFFIALIASAFALTPQQANNQDVENSINIMLGQYKNNIDRQAFLKTQVDLYKSSLNLSGINWSGINWLGVVPTGINWTMYGS